jgi:hypothetical protein
MRVYPKIYFVVEMGRGCWLKSPTWQVSRFWAGPSVHREWNLAITVTRIPPSYFVFWDQEWWAGKPMHGISKEWLEPYRIL